jgi:hypothetical protein
MTANNANNPTTVKVLRMVFMFIKAPCCLTLR